jgi:ribose 5-phosphate isomerase B
MSKPKLSIGADHAGFTLKEKVRKYLEEKGIEVCDFGCYSEERVDYPDFGHAVAHAVEKGESDFGVIICGSGNGINMAANKHAGIRSALCWNKEIAVLARQHNNANIIALPARFISTDEAFACVEAFLNTPFEGGRHTDRVNKINC